jgi:O-antigen/teichoic acid export membrane protein
MVFASGSNEGMRKLLSKSFKVTLLMTIAPLAVISAFGTYGITAWTGLTDSNFQTVLILLSLQALLQSFALLSLVLYRSSGKALMDNLREVARLAILAPVVYFSRRLGLNGVLGGLAVAELIGLIVMLFALAKTFHVFDLKRLLNDTLKMIAATTVMLACGYFAAKILIPALASMRSAATVRLGIICLAMAGAAYPAFALTGALTKSEVGLILDTVKRKAAKERQGDD